MLILTITLIVYSIINNILFNINKLYVFLICLIYRVEIFKGNEFDRKYYEMTDLFLNSKF